MGADASIVKTETDTTLCGLHHVRVRVEKAKAEADVGSKRAERIVVVLEKCKHAMDDLYTISATGMKHDDVKQWDELYQKFFGVRPLCLAPGLMWGPTGAADNAYYNPPYLTLIG